MIIEAEGGTEPHFREPDRLEDGEIYALQGGFDPPLGLVQRKREPGGMAEGNEDKPVDASRLCRTAILRDEASSGCEGR
ncbi:MAG: hypothetical protein ACJ746_19495 [Bryobacteraceae bacterium]